MTNQAPKPTTETRSIVYQTIDGERDYQDQTFPGTPTLEQSAALIDEYAVKLAALFAPSPSRPSPSPNDTDALEYLREIAGVAVRAMEEHGVVPRANHVPAALGITGTMHIMDKRDSAATTLPANHPANTGKR